MHLGVEACCCTVRVIVPEPKAPHLPHLAHLGCHEGVAVGTVGVRGKGVHGVVSHHCWVEPAAAVAVTRQGY